MPSRFFQRKMYTRYKKNLATSFRGNSFADNGNWYSLSGSTSAAQPRQREESITWSAGPQSNRFKHIRQPENVRLAVRKELRRILKPKTRPVVHAAVGFVRYFATSAVLFCILLFAFNIQAYGNVFSYWWTTNFGNSEHASEPFAYVEQQRAENEAQKLLPLPAAEAASLEAPVALAPSTEGISISPPDNRIMIPKIGQNIPIKEIDSTNLVNQNWADLEQDIQEGLKDGVVRYPGTALPGQRGNVFVTGHSSYYLWDPGRYKDVFALLHQVVLGDTITVFYNQDRFDYKVVEIKVVRPDEIDVLQQTDDKRITLMTCTPIGTAINRLVVIAEQVE